MTVATVVTMGYGLFGSVSGVALLGYSIEASVRGGGSLKKVRRHKMSSSNRNVSAKGKNITNMGKMKDTRYGADTSGNAKNKISGPAGLLTKEQSPTAWPQSRNRGKKYSGGGANKPHNSKRYS